MGIPTLIVFHGGKEVDRVVGAVRKEVLKGKLEKVLTTAAAKTEPARSEPEQQTAKQS